ncbi:P-loop NTPase [Candidatus Bathyarchaeota archaeon]|nr:P-loop NTPase [Candidatus Bathyarchaeota archaeon]MBS7631588.1 P-loop NTPase [Candidatus Bathyarchaeota archaeon]
MADPRLEILERRLANVRKIIAVSSGKGGVGKSVTSVVLALALRDRRFKVGLLDLDFTSPSTHVILGVRDLQPIEDYGIIPPVAGGLSYMSIVFYAFDNPAPLRGLDVSNSLIELMAITRWGELDYLIIDMPPGLGDATLDVIRLVKNISFLIVTTPSILAFETVKKLVNLLNSLKTPILGVVENMVMDDKGRIRGEVDKLGVRYLGEIAYDAGLEASMGSVEKLKGTRFYVSLERILKGLL